jgi:RNA polymerase sigma-70 factor, ECF subfamily
MSASDGYFPAVSPRMASELVQEAPALSRPRSEDDLLMLRVQEGDQSALGELFEKYAGTVLSIGMRILRDSGEAQELVQDVFLNVHQKRQLFDPRRGTVRAWLLQTAYHRAFDRREYLQLRRFYDSRNLDELTEAMPSSSDVEYEAQLAESEAVLKRTFEELNLKQREILTLFFFEGYTLREISQRLNESLENVRHSYYRGLKRVKDSLDTNLLSKREQ